MNISPGRKEIIWDYSESLYGYNVNVEFEIAYKLMFDPLRFTNTNYDAAKRKGVLKVRWEGSFDEDEVKLELLKDGIVEKSYEQLPNSGFFAMDLGKRKGKGYAIRISSKEEKLNTINSREFKIKPSVPFAVKMIPAYLAVGYGIYWLITYEAPLPPLELPPEPQ